LRPGPWSDQTSFPPQLLLTVSVLASITGIYLYHGTPHDTPSFHINTWPNIGLSFNSSRLWFINHLGHHIVDLNFNHWYSGCSIPLIMKRSSYSTIIHIHGRAMQKHQIHVSHIHWHSQDIVRPLSDSTRFCADIIGISCYLKYVGKTKSAL